MDILEKIIAHKHKEVAENKSLYPVKLLQRSMFCNSKTVSLSKYILRDDKNGIIAEFKRKSPSKGLINGNAKVEKVSIGYMQAGASALSVLTDTTFFGGKNADLTEARKFNYCPILRKDFIVDEYQIIEAKSIGADAILLIAAALSPEKTLELAKFANSLGLEVLLELHSETELNHINQFVNVVGVNNRNLKTFEVDIQNSINIGKFIADDFVKISESGISKPQTIMQLREHGFKGFLIGEKFMKTDRPEKTCMKFINELKSLRNES